MKALFLSALAGVGIAATAGTASAQYPYYGGGYPHHHHHHGYPGYGAYYPGYAAYAPGFYRPGFVVAAPPVVVAPPVIAAPGYAPYVPYQPGLSFGFTIR